jgi:hypothetical protein
MRSGIAREVTGMQAVARLELHKVRHRRSAEMRARRFSRLSHIHIGLYHLAASVHVVPIEAGSMVMVFANYPESASGRSISFPPRGNMRHRDFLTSSQEKGLLPVQPDHDGRPPFMEGWKMRSYQIIHRTAAG